MSTAQHSRMITAAARTVLRPLGCVQKGRSRIWLDDQGWWIGVVEFQPSSWGKGSHLNVGACWLWHEKNFVSFDAGDRVESFHEFISEEQFSAAAMLLARRAAQEVLALRERFPSVAHASAWMTANASPTLWNTYHSAVSAGLAGEVERSGLLFAEVIADPYDAAWAVELKQRSVVLQRCLESGLGFEQEIAATIGRTRAALGLPAQQPAARQFEA
ncbi:hypothetical protein [Stenotrophomonas sp. YIM B13575]|uniref:hypothetical protein n=1 Tax=Stenotrophomonas sp. YIM B13575 TaxID=3366314 RepID=UPI00368FAAF7